MNKELDTKARKLLDDLLGTTFDATSLSKKSVIKYETMISILVLFLFLLEKFKEDAK